MILFFGLNLTSLNLVIFNGCCEPTRHGKTTIDLIIFFPSPFCVRRKLPTWYHANSAIL